eukprot:1161585-Pelagomonas_calceolata.AAC.15
MPHASALPRHPAPNVLLVLGSPQTTKGLELLDKAIQKAPSLIELFTTRARLLKHAGDYEGGCEEGAAHECSHSHPAAHIYGGSHHISPSLRFKGGDALFPPSSPPLLCRNDGTLRRCAFSRVCFTLLHVHGTPGAAHSAETARRMDLSDRYLNSIAVKALFAAGKPEEVSVRCC